MFNGTFKGVEAGDRLWSAEWSKVGMVPFPAQNVQERKDEIYRIARELLRNAFQHAQARQIEAEIRYDNAQLRLRIRDDGKGIDRKVLQEGSRTGHWGLPGIRERAKRIGARLDFWSEAEAGTEAELTVPASVAYAKASNGCGRDSGGFRLFRRKTGTHAN